MHEILLFNNKTEEKTNPAIQKRRQAAIVFILAAIFFSSLFLNSCKSGDPAFFDKVLNNFDSSSYYIALNIKSPYYKGRVLIQNDDLFNFLNKTEGLNKTEYHSKIKKILLYNRYLKIDEKNITKWKFIRVKYVASVNYAATAGPNKFIAHYFDGVVMSPALTYDEIYAVINQLFYWSIPIRVDPVSKQLLLDD